MAFVRPALSPSTLDRAAHLRADPQLVSRLVKDPATRLVVVSEGHAPVEERPEGVWLVNWLASRLPNLAESSMQTLFLGADADGHHYLAVASPNQFPLQDGARWAGLREVGSLLDDFGSSLLTTAIAVLAWHSSHPRCARCGEATEVVHAGWLRRCPACHTDHYPRTDPAVIMTITGPDDRLLLGRQASWPEGRFSTLAGFVEPGESLEDAVRREVLEESGIVVGDVEYRSSQPWPFPSSLMLAFRGKALTTETKADGDELAQVGWWSREEVLAESTAGRLLLPPRFSVARGMIEEWYGEPLTRAQQAWR